MSTFKQFLVELKKQKTSNYVVDVKMTPTTIEKIYDTLNTDYSDGLKAIKNGGVLFRGYSKFISGDNNKKIFHVNSAKSNRLSKDTYNVYQAMMDVSPALKRFPSRSNSLICTSSFSTALKYSKSSKKVFMVVPKNGTKIASCAHQSDFINTGITYNGVGFLNGIKADIRDLDNAIFGYYKMIAKPIDTRIDSFQTLKSAFEKNIDEKRFTKYLERYYTATSRDPISPSAFLDGVMKNIMTPEGLDIGLSKFGSSKEIDVECWFSGECILIDYKLAIEMFKMMIATDETSVHRRYQNIIIDFGL